MADLALIKKLRETTGCGIADCNKALAACNDNYEEAVDWLRKKGLSSAAKKSGRNATEGLIGIFIDNSKASIVEVNSETDFVARNDKFQELVLNCAKAAINVDNSEDIINDIKNQTIGSKKISDEFTDKIASIGENLQLRKAKIVGLTGEGVIVSYIHNQVSNNLGKIGVLVMLESSADKNNLQELGKQIAMHVAATRPEYLDRSQVPSDRLNREKEVLIEQAKNSGKPQNIIDKMIEGRIKKFYEEICLVDQAFVMDDKMKISDVLKNFEKTNRHGVKIQDYVLFVLGEGLEKKENDFAAEVASMVK